MHKSRLGNLVIDCKTEDLLAEAQFWSVALGYPLPPDVDPSSRFIQLVTPPGDVQVIIQQVQHDPRVHLDIETNALGAEIERLACLGAEIVARRDGWVVMQAPSGHRFCVGSPYRGGFEQEANLWE